jgi:hypothetical protein
MKKIMTFVLVLLTSGTLFSQSTPASPERQNHFKKSKNQKTVAWILLAGGVALTGTGFLIGDRTESTFDDAATGAIIGGIGVLATIGSIPLFIASGRNKRKGMAVTFRNMPVLQIKNSSLVYQPMPAVSFKLSL